MASLPARGLRKHSRSVQSRRCTSCKHHVTSYQNQQLILILVLHIPVNKNMASTKTPECGVSYAWPAGSSAGVDASMYIRAEKLAEETMMDYNVGLRMHA